ncbi:hypothetical protein NIES4075_50120 [Tolypothrix sp. NIES-4075]|uniref:hypothetical protein n=1 Tax=Tolypothrix sp. NIES-4075 TaxID=2005459 RepID=UPI000B72D5A6|nr:hypothetical protein [Tolypothrix sp. NIES-4075]GAX43997.1 hypothetical protein NIES4075_50120 [Tolypothrix sp. NIES-4075]
MLKNFAFGLLAATLAIAPGAAFAGQSQSNVQVTRQDGAAINGSTSVQNSSSVNVQQQIQRANQLGNRYRGGYYNKPSYCPGRSSAQSQSSVQRTSQSGAAIDGSVNAQDSTTRNNQRQTLASGCR